MHCRNRIAVTLLAVIGLAACSAETPPPPDAPAAGKVTNERVLAEAARGENWFLKGGNFRGEHYSPLAQVTDQNVADLGLAWAADLPAPDGIATTPIVVDGVIYLSAAYSVVFAINAATGEVLWTFDPDVRQAFAADPWLSWVARASRGIAVWDGRVYATTADCQLIALDAATGAETWRKQTCDIARGYAVTDSPYVGGGKIFVGNAGSEELEKNRGYVTAYDAKSGDLLWRFFIVPSDNPAENDTAVMKMAAKTWSGDTLEKHGGGGNTWNEMTYDPVTDLLFFGTAGSYPYIHEKRSPDGGDNLFLSSVVALHADTGAYAWHYQTVDRDSWDYNVTMNIVLADLTIDGEDRETVLIAPKNGFHYALDRLTGELLTAGKFAKVNWATHIDRETGRPVYDPAGAYWQAADNEITTVWPNMWGAHSWHPMAFHPGHKLSYIPVVDVPSIVDNDGDGDDIVLVTEVDGEPHAPGKLVAFDPVSETIRWTVEHALPFNGGVMATAGDLVFQGTSAGHFTAYGAASGEKLWSVQTGTAINAAPASYAIDGTQYILIPIGPGGGLQFLYPEMHATNELNGPTRLLAFTLGGGSAMPALDDTARALPDQPALEASAETVERGKALYRDYCTSCHGATASARAGGSVPDLRYADADTHASWDSIVIDGARRLNGMPAFELDPADADAIRNYILSLSEKLRAAQ